MTDLLLSGIAIILVLGIYALISFGLYKLACRVIEKNPFKALMIASFGIFLFPIGIFVPVKVWSKLAKYASTRGNVGCQSCTRRVPPRASCRGQRWRGMNRRN